MQIYNQEYKSGELKFAEMVSENVRVSIYSKADYNQFKLLDDFDDVNKNYNVKVPNFKSVYLVVKSLTPDRIGKFSIKTKAVLDHNLGTGAIVGIVIGSVAFCGIIAVVTFC